MRRVGRKLCTLSTRERNLTWKTPCSLLHKWVLLQSNALWSIFADLSASSCQIKSLLPLLANHFSSSFWSRLPHSKSEHAFPNPFTVVSSVSCSSLSVDSGTSDAKDWVSHFLPQSDLLKASYLLHYSSCNSTHEHLIHSLHKPQ